MMKKARKLPLDGIRILSLTQSWTGPFASMLLGDLGAEVLRLEQIQYMGGMTRGAEAYPNEERWKNNRNGGIMQYVDRKPWGPNGEQPWNRFSFGNCHLQNTLSFTLDFSRPKGWELITKLVGMCDIFIENNTPTTLPKLGFTREYLHETNDRLIIIRSPGFGLDGPHMAWKGFGRNIEAAIGHAWLMRYDEKPEHLISNKQTYVMDNLGAHSVAIAAMMGLLNREKTGKGCFIELAQAEGAMAAMPAPWMNYFANGRLDPPRGNRHATAVQGCYPAAGNDQWVVITIATEAEWSGFCKALDNPAWTLAPEFADVAARLKNQDILDENIAAWTGKLDNYYIMHLLQAHGVPAGPVMTEAMTFADEHIQSRDFFIEETQKWCGTHLYTGYTGKFKRLDRKNRADLPACGLGEHNEYVFKTLLNVSDEEYVKLEQEQYIGTDILRDAKASM